MSKRIAFTLAEIMIVLAVIGVLTAVLLPVAINSTPNENVMKFKKAHNTLLTTVRELVNSDKYYSDGDLGTRADGNPIYVGTDWRAARRYFCQTFAEVLNTKQVSCGTSNTTHCGAIDLRSGADFSISPDNTPALVTAENLNKAKARLDEACKTNVSAIPPETDFGSLTSIQVEIITTDGTSWWETNPASYFGFRVDGTMIERFSPPSIHPANFADENGFDVVYKVFCFDIDGINEGEDPFGYGIRRDGKVIFGARADEWLQKSIQEKE